MNELETWREDVIGHRAAKALNGNGFTAVYCSGRAEALAYVLDRIAPGATVGVGGSRTLADLGLSSALAARGNTVLDHNAPGLTLEEKDVLRRGQLTCDVFLTGANAVTLTGELVNRDGIGNRVAAMIFGPGKVLVVAGVNKIVRDVHEADRRIRTHAAPMNNKRLATKNPCVALGECVDCKTESRICNVTTILHRRPMLTDMHVVLVGEVLGF